jgi:hypothetical protein
MSDFVLYLSLKLTTAIEKFLPILLFTIIIFSLLNVVFYESAFAGVEYSKTVPDGQGGIKTITFTSAIGGAIGTIITRNSQGGIIGAAGGASVSTYFSM